MSEFCKGVQFSVGSIFWFASLDVAEHGIPIDVRTLGPFPQGNTLTPSGHFYFIMIIVSRKIEML
jgi:hypothetical protein